MGRIVLCCIVWSVMSVYAVRANDLPEDTVAQHAIEEVTVQARRVPVAVSSAQPLQSMTGEQMQALGIQSVADAVKRFAGVSVRDYGGIGGLKTVSVRSLGAAHTAVSYDGVTVSNCQAGQIDIGRFSLDNVEELSLAVGQGKNLLQSARAYASAGILDIRTLQPRFADNKSESWRVQMRGGSFGYVMPSLRYARKLGSHTRMMLEGDYMRADGIYPFALDNGREETTERRNNSDINSWHVEGNLYHTFKNEGHLQAKGYFFRSGRGLPGSVILYNPTARERLWDENFFTQLAYDRQFSTRWQWRGVLKYNHAWNRYEDVNVKYSGGKLIDRHRQDEYYASFALKWQPVAGLALAWAQDGIVNTLRNNIDDSPNPLRFTSLTALNAEWRSGGWNIQAGLVGTFATDEVQSGDAPADCKHLSPSLSVSFRPWGSLPFYVRALYKNTFRVPTFNDLYYRRSGNTALRPEDATEYNLGITWSGQPVAWLDNLSLTVDAYYNKVKDKIVAFPSVYVWRMANYGEADIKGLDVSWAAAVTLAHGWNLELNGAYTYQEAKDVTNPSAKNYKHQLPYTPRHSGNVSALFNTPWCRLGYTLMMVGKRYFMDQNIPANEIEGYVEQTLSLSHEWRWNDRYSLRLQADCVNLADRQYEVVRYYPMPGRSWRLTGVLEF